MVFRVIRVVFMVSSYSNGIVVKLLLLICGMWVNGFRLSSICGNFVNELSRYSVMNLISMFYVIGVNCGVNLNNFMVIVDNSYMVGSCMVVVLIMVGSLLLMLLMVML